MSKFSVLIVDDDEIERHLLKRDFKKVDLEISVFEKSDGQEAVEFLKNIIKTDSFTLTNTRL